MNYTVVLFKNKKRKRIIKKFITFSKAKTFYENLLSESNKVIFNILFENGEECKYEIGIIEKSSGHLIPVYLTDEMGRNVRVKLEESGMTLSHITTYKKEESLYDLQIKKKITTQELIKSYLKHDGMKMLSVLNNKIIIQKDDNVTLFSLKSEEEAGRFIDCLSLHFFKIKRGD